MEHGEECERLRGQLSASHKQMDAMEDAIGEALQRAIVAEREVNRLRVEKSEARELVSKGIQIVESLGVGHDWVEAAQFFVTVSKAESPGVEMETLRSEGRRLRAKLTTLHKRIDSIVAAMRGNMMDLSRDIFAAQCEQRQPDPDWNAEIRAIDRYLARLKELKQEQEK